MTLSLRNIPKAVVASVAAGAAILATALPAAAHHAFNMFALDQVVTMTGTVKSYDFRMPHVWIYMVSSSTKAPEDWGFECHAPNLIARKGWTIGTLKPGDKITLRMHPMRDGSKAGSVIDITLADGRTLWNAQSVNQP
jgi:hypothetical protein